MQDVFYSLSKINKMIMTFLKLQTYYNRFRSRPMALWTKEKSFSLFCIRWRLWSRRRILLDFSLSPRKSIKITSMMKVLLIWKLASMPIWPFTTTIKINMLNAAVAIESFGKHSKKLKRLSLKFWTSTFQHMLEMFYLIMWPFSLCSLILKQTIKSWKHFLRRKNLKNILSS